MKNTHLIWKRDYSLEDYKDYIEEDLIPQWEKANHAKFQGGVNEFMEYHADYCDEKVYSLHYSYLDDERNNLNKETKGEIICIENLGDKDCDYSMERYNVANCLHNRHDTNMDIYYVEEENGVLEYKAKDAYNDYLFRELKPDLTNEETKTLLDLIESGKATIEEINKYTLPLGQEIQKVYGFDINKPQMPQEYSVQELNAFFYNNFDSAKDVLKTYINNSAYNEKVSLFNKIQSCRSLDESIKKADCEAVWKSSTPSNREEILTEILNCRIDIMDKPVIEFYADQCLPLCYTKFLNNELTKDEFEKGE